MNKRGQFYLIAAIVIIVIILTFFGVKNGVLSNQESQRIYDLKEELNFEGARVVEHGIYNQDDPVEMTALLDDFTDKYGDYAGQTSNLYFVFGNENQIVVKGYEEISTGGICLQIGTTCTGIPQLEETHRSRWALDVSGDNVDVKIGEQTYNFKLKNSQNFYFVISQEQGGGKQIVTG